MTARSPGSRSPPSLQARRIGPVASRCIRRTKLLTVRGSFRVGGVLVLVASDQPSRIAMDGLCTSMRTFLHSRLLRTWLGRPRAAIRELSPIPVLSHGCELSRRSIRNGSRRGLARSALGAHPMSPALPGEQLCRGRGGEGGHVRVLVQGEAKPHASPDGGDALTRAKKVDGWFVSGKEGGSGPLRWFEASSPARGTTRSSPPTSLIATSGRRF